MIKENGTIILQNCVLFDSLSKKSTQIIVSKPIKQILNNDQWHFGDRLFKDHNAKQLFQIMKICFAKILWLDFNKLPNIIENITSVEYPNLKCLYLGDNNIQNIEELSRLNAPLLEKLYLNHNCITEIKSLRKVYFPNLKELSLSIFPSKAGGNYIVSEDWLTQCSFDHIEKLLFGYNKGKQQLWIESHWYAKAQIKNNTMVYTCKAKISPFSKSSLYSRVSPKPKTKNLFKTFEN